MHKRAVRARGPEAGNLITDGIILHATSDNTVYDVLFAPTTNYAVAESSTSLKDAFATIQSFFNHFKAGIKNRIQEALTLHNTVKVNGSLSLRLRKLVVDDDDMYVDKSLRTKSDMILHADDLDDWINELIRTLLVKYETMPERGSNWSLDHIIDFELHVSKFIPLRGSSYIQLPQKIVLKKAVINVKNFNDNRCFAYSIVAKSLHEAVPKIPHLERVSHYTTKRMNEFNFEGIHFPTPLKDIAIFERVNNVSVNVYGIDEESENQSEIYPLRICKNFIRDRHFDLLYITDEISDEDNGHYCCVTNLSRLVCSQKTRHNGQMFICRRCLQHYPSEAKLEEHASFCIHAPVRSMMPEPKSTQKFEKRQYQMKVPYVIYADFECILRPFHSANRNPAAEHSFTDKKHHHLASSYCYYIVCSNEADDTQYKPVLYRGPDAVKHFWQSIIAEIKKIAAIYGKIEPKVFTLDDVHQLRDYPNECHICGKELATPQNFQTEPESKFPVMDHDHLTGKIRGWACLTCNFAYQLPKFVPIVFHNGSHYDFKLLVREIQAIGNIDTKLGKRVRQRDAQRNAKRRRAEHFNNDEAIEDDIEDEEEEDIDQDDIIGRGEDLDNQDVDADDRIAGGWKRKSLAKEPGDVSILAKNSENFISFEVQITPKLSVRFIDSFRFMSSSLDSLARNLAEDQLTNIRKFFDSDVLFDLAKHKGIFPYEYVTDMEKYEETSLPTIEAFYSLLNDSTITDEEYKRAQQAWREFGCQTLGDYNDIYLKKDVLLLADVFENFRQLCLDIYKLDALWHYSAPGLAWNAMLRLTNVELELLSDYTMYLFYEGSIRGGYCVASERYIEANNRNLPNFDPTKPECVIQYLDKNNLYGDAMSRPLPLRDFVWLTAEEIEQLDISTIDENSPTGYILEVDIEYPQELHDDHNDLPFCPERLRTSTKAGTPPKLLATLHDKRNYIVHYRYLQSALRNGLRLLKIHRGIRFTQMRWMQPYIELNNERRKLATNEFVKDFYKLMNNCCFGKFLESIRKRRTYYLTTSETQLEKFVRRPNFKSRAILNDSTNLVLVEMGQKKIFFNKFIQAGGAILDISKRAIYDFHYDLMKKEIFPDIPFRLSYTDTDSFIYNIQTDSLTDRLLPFKEHFNFSEYPREHPLYDPTNKKVLRKMKDEAKGKHITAFCALKAKLYAFIVEGEEHKKAKGVKKNVVKKSLNFKDYVSCLTSFTLDNNEDDSVTTPPPPTFYRTMTTIRSYQQQIYTIQQRKKALTMLDDKRYIIFPEGIQTYAWGHYRIPEGEDLVSKVQSAANAENSTQNVDYDSDVDGDV